jgi:hypothetical protein
MNFSSIMECAFLSLARELRDIIYCFAIDYPNLRHLVNVHLEKTRLALSARLGTNVAIENVDRLLEWTSIDVFERPVMTCPSLFLVCRQITEEAQLGLYAKRLFVNVPVSSSFNRDRNSLGITDFIGEIALTRVRNVQLTVIINDLRDANNW